jgi:O-antigen ligase
LNLSTQKYNVPIHIFLLCSIAFFIPIYKTVVPVLIMLLALNWLTDAEWRQKVERFKKQKALWLPVLFFVSYLMGMFHTSNIETGFKIIETKLAFLILPLIIGSSRVISLLQFKKIIFSFIIGCLVSVIFLFCMAVFNYYNEIYLVQQGELRDVYINVNYFFSGLLAYFHHPSYLSMYLVFAMGLIFYLLGRSKEFGLSKRVFVLLLGMIPVLMVFILLLASKIGIAAMLLIFIIEMAVLFWQTGYIRSGIVVFMGIGIISFFVISNSPIIKSRFLYMFEGTSAEDKHTTIESNASRAIAWECSWDLIKESPYIGYGTGDVPDVLVGEYLNRKYMGVYAEKLNAHDQFFQSTLAVGLTGFLSLLAIFIVGMINSIRRGNRLAVIFLTLVFVNILVESMFETEGGVVFFSFFFCVLLMREEFSRAKEHKS